MLLHAPSKLLNVATSHSHTAIESKICHAAVPHSLACGGFLWGPCSAKHAEHA